MQDYYQILGISSTATSGQIKVAYRRLALKYHPDRNPDNSLSEERFVEIATAYEILSDPVKRSKYDNGISIDLNEDFEPGYQYRRRPPPPYYYQQYKPEKTKYSRRDYTYGIASVVAIVIVAVIFPIYLLQMKSTKYYHLAIDNYFAGKYYSSLHNIDLSITDLSSNNEEACALASVILVHKLQKYDYALKYIDQGLDYDPEDSLASEFHYLRGLCLTKKSEPLEALQEFAQVHNYSSTYDSSLYRTAAILIFHQLQLDSAELVVEDLLSRNNLNYGADYLKGIIYEKKSEPAIAHDIFSKLVDKPFNQAAIFYHLAQSEIKLNLSDSACAHLQIASNYQLMEAKQLMNLYCKKESIFMSPYD